MSSQSSLRGTHSSITAYAHSAPLRTQPLTKQRAGSRSMITEITPLAENLIITYIPPPSTELGRAVVESSKLSSLPKFDAEKGNPWRLFLNDTGTFLRLIPSLRNATRPSQVPGEEPEPETWRSKRDQIVLTFVSVMEVLFIPIVIFAWLSLPGLACLVFISVLVLILKAILKTTQGDRVLASKGMRKLADNAERGESSCQDTSKERWVFVNGVMTTTSGLQSAIDRIEEIFGRPVVGIHNATNGAVGDIIECLIQRCFMYYTADVRVAYDYLHYYLVDPKVDKVVFMAHSQGGIIASLVVDMLLAEVPKECLAKLEVYTFGSAASHFSNPLLALPPGSKPNHYRDVDTKRSSNDSPAMQSLNLLTQKHSPSSKPSPQTPFIAISSETPSSNRPIPRRRNRIFDPSRPFPPRSLSHIEHFANVDDPIPQWGVLACMSHRRYAGNVFVLSRSGHLFTKHYLAAMFPKDACTWARFWDHKVKVDLTRAKGAEVCSCNKKMDDADVGRNEGEDSEGGEREAGSDIDGNGPEEIVDGGAVKELSWLYKYTNGGSRS